MKKISECLRKGHFSYRHLKGQFTQITTSDNMIVIKVWCQKAKTTAVFPIVFQQSLTTTSEFCRRKSHKKAKRGGFCRWKTTRPQPRLLFSFALLNNFGFLRSLSGLAVVRVVKCFLFHNLKYLNNGSVEALNLGTTLGSKYTFIFIRVSFQWWLLWAKL